MICNTNQLVQMRQSWLTQARTDLRNQLINFMEVNRVNEQELANILALPVDSISAILNATRDITLVEFASLLIATDNVLEIKPVSKSMLGKQPRQGGFASAPKREPNGRFAKRKGGEPQGGMMPPMGGMPMGYPMPPMGGMPMGGGMMPPMGGMPMGGGVPERFGGMPGIMHTPQSEDKANEGSIVNNPNDNLDSMNRSQLIDTIVNNGWDNEIDLARSTRSNLIDFLNSKNQQQQNHDNGGDESNQSFEDMAKNFVSAMKDNPQMMDMFKSMFGGK